MLLFDSRSPVVDHSSWACHPRLGNHIAEIRSVESEEPEAHVVVVRNCGDFLVIING
ncbi:hypothetical protein K443DRAFT_535333 [Laccaria amethystina LaAM-08-1]|uniref:Unplaced genomic scaffold K443scaffold_6, whole genome shotgun sequence n=1 Tax=Laccaria amethystina LaAM-08-1 TaxID=1095629 RepID=A0A0C9X979_9AGAR|nr:hypothetical protein K443DRAFT_535333 [Laccaria amethystina LaAM-08-1]